MTVGRICVREVDVVEPEESAQTAAQRMHSRKVGTLVVRDDRGKPIGIVTDRDPAVRVLAEARDPFQTLIRDIMTPWPHTVSEDTPLEEALAVMRTGQFRRIPVVDEEGTLAGLLSLDDILSLLAEEFSEIGMLINQESPSSLAKS